MGAEVGMEDSPLTGPSETGSPVDHGAQAPESQTGITPPEEEVPGLHAADRVLGALEAALAGDPASFEFFQAVRVLERLRPDRARIGGAGPPADEVVRLSVEPSIAFPFSEIESLEIPEEGPARMSVNFMGLTGPVGVLPHEYTLLVARRKRAQDGALGDFIDLFHHRALSLLYRVWERNHVGTGAKGEDRLRGHLLDLVGMGLSGERDLLPFSDDVLPYYAGLLVQQPRGAAALEQLLTDYFGVEAAVEQFVGGWYPVSVGDQCPVGEEMGASTQLGRGVVVGDEVWDQQMRARVRLGPLSRAQFDRFLPQGSGHASLSSLLRFFSHDQFDWEIQLVLKREEVPGIVLGAAHETPLPLGWSTWIRTRDFQRDADNTVLRPKGR
jgi:type VI secretion system protein ImpH